MPNNLNILYILLHRAYRLLSNDGGILLTQVPALRRIELRNYTEKAHSQGIDIVIPAIDLLPRLRIIKYPDSPKRLPTFTDE